MDETRAMMLDPEFQILESRQQQSSPPCRVFNEENVHIS